MNEISIAELIGEIRRGAKCTLMLRHAERPKMDVNDPSFGDALKITDEGVRTAKKLGEMLRECSAFVQFAASPLVRTRMTAECVAEGMGLKGAPIPIYGVWGNESFYYNDPLQVLDVFKPSNFFPACFEYFKTGEQRGFNNLYKASDELEKWINAHKQKQLFIISTHDLYIAAFLYARKAKTDWARENWTCFLDGGAIVDYPDGTRHYALVRTGLSTGIVGVKVGG